MNFNVPYAVDGAIALPRFVRDAFETRSTESGRRAVAPHGYVGIAAIDKTCECGCRMHVNASVPVTLS